MGKTVINKVSVSDEEDDSSLGSSAAQGLFSPLRNLNKNMGKLVYIMGDTLTERRDQVEDIASNVDTRVTHFGQGLNEWRKQNFGFTVKTEKESGEEVDDADEAVITENTELEV